MYEIIPPCDVPWLRLPQIMFFIVPTMLGCLKIDL